MITIGFSPHRVEALESMAREMDGHDLILLEEPPGDMFGEMLAGRLGIDEYVDDLIPAFPLFTKHACGLLRDLRAAGKAIRQVEPYLATLEQIYELLDEEGVGPATVRLMPGLGAVYAVESRASGALLNFYRKMGGRNFAAAVKACLDFVRADAARLRLRSCMRAEAVARGVQTGEYRGRIYIEAGYIHLSLLVFLRRYLAECGISARVRPRFLLARALAETAAGAPRQLYAPGDVLTLRAVLGAPTSRKLRELLAARAIVYSALLSKREKMPTPRVRYPHLAEELQLLAHVRSLDYAACEERFHRYLRTYTL